METHNKGRRNARAAILAVLSSGLALASCGHPGPHRGGIDFVATLPTGVAVELLTYKLTGPGFGGLAGGIHVSTPEQEFEKLINYVPVGDDYELDLGAASLDGRFTCTSATKVSVRQNTITRVHVELACNAGDGNVLINVSVANAGACSAIPSVDYMVSPLTASVGDAIAVTATTHASDAGAD